MRRSLRARLRDERGFFTGNLLEPLICIPMLSVLMLAAFLLLNDAMKTQARTRSQTVGYQHTTRAFDSVVRELRSANSITYHANNCSSSCPQTYGTGETNWITANTILNKDTYGCTSATPCTQARDVDYNCIVHGGAVGSGGNAPECRKIYQTGDPPAGTAKTCTFFPTGGIASGTGDSCSSFTSAWSQYQNNLRENDFAWIYADYRVFRFVDSQGTSVDPTTTAPDAVEFRPQICLRSPDCTSPGASRVMKLTTTIFWRNRPPASADDDPCNDTDTTNDPPTMILNPDWPDQTPQSIPNPDACDPADS